MTNKTNSTLYIGVTSEHKNALVDGFTKKYNLKKLVFYEVHSDIMEAIKREKQLKSWKRDWKIDLIEKENMDWSDLYDSLV